MCTWLILLFAVLLQNIQVNGRYLNWESRNGLNKILVLSLSRYFLTLVGEVNLLLAFIHILLKYSGNFKLLSMVMPNSFTVLVSYILCSPVWVHTCSYFLPEMRRLRLPEFIFMYLKTEVTKIQSTPNFPKNERFLPPDTHTYVCVSGGKKRSFFGKFDVLFILVTSSNFSKIKFKIQNVTNVRFNIIGAITDITI